jgi:hypothetical protein
MLRCGFGLKDAPRLWQKRLDAAMRELKFRPLRTDPQVYTLYEDQELVARLTSHVDDLKGGAKPEVRAIILMELEKVFDKLTVNRSPSECLGTKHEQDLEKGELWIHQHHYVES